MLSSEPAPDGAAATYFEDLFENAPCGYLVVAPDGRISNANATIGRWIGAGPADLVGRPLRDFLAIPARIFYETIFAPLLRLQGSLEETALDLVTSDGGKLALIVNAVEKRDANEALTEIRLIAIRATERRSYERDLQDREAVAVAQLADAQAVSVLREQFIAVLGHDLRNPLSSVSSGVRLLQRDPSPEKAERIAAMMHASVLRMSGMIDNVLDFARGRLGGGISLQRDPVELETAVQQVVDEIRAAYPERTISLDCDLPALVDCDAPRVSQMLSNLVGNACSHGDPATNVAVAAYVSDDVLEISVTNGGASIPDHKMRALFEPFSHDPGSTPRQGLGLGLYISSQIAKSHGGSLTASSSDHETRFTFRMPLASA